MAIYFFGVLTCYTTMMFCFWWLKELDDMYQSYTADRFFVALNVLFISLSVLVGVPYLIYAILFKVFGIDVREYA